MLFSNYVLRAWNAVVDGSKSMFCRWRFLSLIIGQHLRLTKSLKRSQTNINSRHNRVDHKKWWRFFEGRECVKSQVWQETATLCCDAWCNINILFLLFLSSFGWKLMKKSLFWTFFCWIWIEIFCRLAEIEAPARRRWWIIGEWYKFWQRRFNEATTSSPIDGQS